ncbi:hypothetical protein ABIE26_000186 [Pedobacter africanus]|uniref:Uncharacterized protein n=1 Tax=Pedobacter africanus TaxID=151894 RepID=A0ACC6KVT0_9SPHI|nr:hypothetical protein [Pedobacter africanus]MDR6783326.1 hypothetical protein [Pedobacter africanus]
MKVTKFAAAVVLYLSAAKQIEAQVDKMLSVLDKAGVDKTLQAILAGKMTRLVAFGNGSYKEINILQAIQIWIFQLSENEFKEGITEKLVALMVRLNFKSDGFKHYCRALAPPSSENYRITVAFSVDALAYFFKLLINAGVVVAEPKSHLFLFVARHFKTPGISGDRISEHSFTNKYNQTVQATAKTVRAALVRMLKLLDKEFDLA